jgi:hypothetical protein
LFMFVRLHGGIFGLLLLQAFLICPEGVGVCQQVCRLRYLVVGSSCESLRLVVL